MPQANPSSTPVQSRGQMAIETRLAPIGTVDAERRTADVVWSTGAAVRRYDWWNERWYREELSLDPAHVRMGRMQSGAPLLNSHSQWDLRSVIGVVESASLAGAEAVASVRFSARADVEPIFQDVRAGILRNISVGYVRHRVERIAPEQEGADWTYRVVDWEPMEISLVPIPADAGAQVRAGDTTHPPERALRTAPCEFIDFPPTAAIAEPTLERSTAMLGSDGTSAAANSPAQQEEVRNSPPVQAPAQPDTAAITEAAVRAERERVDAIRRLTEAPAVRALGDDTFVRGLANLTVEQARSQIIDRLTAQSDATASRSAADVRTISDETDVRRAAITEALQHRANPSQQLPERARAYRGFTLIELARHCLEAQGVRTQGMSRAEIAGMALTGIDGAGLRSMHGTSDFTVALANTVNRSLRAGYESAPRTFTMWARRGTLADFRPATRVAVAGNLALEKVNEFGEFKRGKIVDAGESIQLATYGKVVGVTRQGVINDDLDMLGRLPRMFGRAAADFESDTVYGILTANAAMSDTVALFHATHGNLGTPGAPSETTLSEMRRLVRLQTDPSGNAKPLNLTVRYIITPAALETATQKLLNAVIVATKSADTNVFNGAYQHIVEARLDANSATAWYGAASPDQIDTVEYAYLEGEEGLFTEQRVGFDVDGLEVKARLDFASKAIDHRGLFRNAGA